MVFEKVNLALHAIFELKQFFFFVSSSFFMKFTGLL